MEGSLDLQAKVAPNHLVNADARGSAVLCAGWQARAGYWGR